MMQPTIVRAWLGLLRSGFFDQGEGFLFDADGRCCVFGVLHIACEQAELKLPNNRPFIAVRAVDYGDGPAMPHPVACIAAGVGYDEKHGLLTDPEAFVHCGEVWDLANLNDQGTPFAELADLIERAHVCKFGRRP